MSIIPGMPPRPQKKSGPLNGSGFHNQEDGICRFVVYMARLSCCNAIQTNLLRRDKPIWSSDLLRPVNDYVWIGHYIIALFSLLLY